MVDDILTQKILILAANPKGTDKLRLDEEARDIKEGLRQARERERFTIESEWAVRPKDVRRSILNFKPEIVHFSGHGDEDGGLALENEVGQIQLVQPDALAGLFKLFSHHVRCVLLNACYSEIQADAIAEHIDFVIGMSKGIGDRAAIEFAVGFYDALGAGCSVEVAYEFGCNAIQMAGIKENLIPILKHKQTINTQQTSEDVESSSIQQYMQKSKARVATLVESKITYEFVLTGKIDEVNKQKLQAIVTHLQEVTGDTSLTLMKVEAGSIRLILEGTEEGFQVLESLIASGKFKQVLGMPIHRVSRQEVFVPVEGKLSAHNNPKASPPHKVTLYLPPDLHRQLKIRAAVNSNALSKLAERAIAFYLSHPESVDQLEEEVNYNISNLYNLDGETFVISDGELATFRNESQDLVQAAQDVESLLEKLEEEFPDDSLRVLAAKAIDRVENNSDLKSRIIKGVQGASLVALEEMVNHPVTQLFIEGAESVLNSAD
jgi:CHAT domain